ncbi:hypothetical protein VP395_10315 [Mariniflexile soesokkakense]|uniref:Glucosamine inositolphosphorylceramide transferase 1 N-terminal domain-containing protein n=1 Tax=Mariniflexile soesokkakense TaxID=1343160 RepID=A0ABV0AAW5_9FLAO
MTKNKKLKVGILIDQKEIFNWQLYTIEYLKKQNFVDINLIYIPIEHNQEKRKATVLYKLISALYKTIQGFESNLFSEIGPNAFTKKTINLDCDIALANSNELLEYLNNTEHDVLLNFSDISFPEKLLNCTKFGIWQIFSGSTFFCNEFIGLIEVFNKEKTHSIFLEKLESGSNAILYKSTSQVNKINLLRNNNQAFWKAPHIISRKLNQVHLNNFLRTEKKNIAKNHSTSICSSILIKYICLFPIRYIQWLFTELKAKLFFNQWIIMYQFNDSSNLKFSFKDFKKIIPPKDRIWADPFVFKKNNEFYIFVEELLFSENKGFISYFKIDKNGNYTQPKKIIENDFHMSYPFLIEDNDDLYMIPETSENKSIMLYKCIEFPNKWEFVHNLIENIEAVDTTILYSNNKYWMFTNIRENKGICFEDELFVFYSDSLLSKKWTLHPKSPVLSDVTLSRAAGNLFVYNNQIIRPSQNSSNHYGYGLNMSKISKLSLYDYDEELVEKFTPNWDRNIVSIHTFNKINNFVVIDAEINRMKPIKLK